MFWILFRKELLESWRTYRFLTMIVVLVAFGLLSPVSARFAPEIVKLAAGDQEGMEALVGLIPTPTVTDALDQYLKNLIQLGLIVVILLAMGLVAREKDKGTATLVLVRPVGRSLFLWVKFAAFVLLLFLSLVAAGLACYLYTGLLFSEWLDLGAFLSLNGLMFLYLLVPAALTFLGSTLSKSAFAAAGIGFGGWLVLSLLGGIRALGDYLPGRLSSAAAGLVRGLPFEAWAAVLISLGLVLLFLGLASVAFQKQEL